MNGDTVPLDFQDLMKECASSLVQGAKKLPKLAKNNQAANAPPPQKLLAQLFNGLCLHMLSYTKTAPWNYTNMPGAQTLVKQGVFNYFYGALFVRNIQKADLDRIVSFFELICGSEDKTDGDVAGQRCRDFLHAIGAMRNFMWDNNTNGSATTKTFQYMEKNLFYTADSLARWVIKHAPR